MDAVTIGTIASTAISLLVPFLKSIVNGTAERTGEEIGAKAGNLAWEKAKQLHEVLKEKFSSKPETKKNLAVLEKTPDDKEIQSALCFQLKDIFSNDENFAKEIALILKEASDSGADAIFQTTITGNVKNLIQVGDMFGDINLG